MRLTLGLLIALTACASSTLRLVGSSPSGVARDSLGGLRIEIQGLEPGLASYAQVSVVRTGPDTSLRRVFYYVGFAPIDSLRPGSYRVRVQMIGYVSATLEVRVRPGEVVRLLARMRKSSGVLQPVLNAS